MKFTEEHKQKLREAKQNYYQRLDGKRPYDRTIDKVFFSREEMRTNCNKLIEQFNDIFRKYGDITEEIIEKEIKKDDKKITKYDLTPYL